MTENQAYRAVLIYLDEYFGRNPDAALGQILGELQLVPDGQPFDLAVLNAWKPGAPFMQSHRMSGHSRKARTAFPQSTNIARVPHPSRLLRRVGCTPRPTNRGDQNALNSHAGCSIHAVSSCERDIRAKSANRF
jgi:hypothetical protein